MLLNTAIHYWIFLLSIVSSSWIKYPIEISSIPGWHKEPTDIKEAQNVCDKDSEINNDLYCYPQCFNKEDDQPKLDHCCFNENGRVLYVSPCTVEPENEATTTEVAADQTETLPAADSTSAATSTVTADLEKYPQCFNKEDDQPKRENCCFDDNDRVLYPKPCYATSEDLVTTTDNATIETTSSVTTDLTSTTTTSTVDDVKKYPQCFNKKNDKPKRKHCCFDNDGKVLYPKPCSVTSKGSTTKTGDDTIIPTSSITTDSSSTTATSTIDDVKKYPQCFNKKNDKPKRKHCCFDNNDRVLYPKPCTKTSERTASTTAENTTESESSSATTLPDSTTESESVSSTFTSDSSTESESISSTTTSDASDSTETHDINRYPRCFFKYSNQPNRSRCCFNSQYQVLYPWPCGGSSDDINTSATDDSTDEISQTTTDSSSTATDIDDGDDENDDMKEYPQCFNKQDDQPKREHCCFDDNDRVLYPKPCSETSETSESETTTTGETTTESESVSVTTSSDDNIESESITSTTTSDASDSTETHDINRYPHCFFKYSNQPNKDRCCFNSRYQVLYPWPCDGSSQSTTTTVSISISGTESSSVTTTFDENLGTSSELTISSSSDLISTSQDIPQATTINNSTTSIESSANGSTLPLTQPILSVSEFESSVSDATNSNSNSNPTFTAEGGHSSDEMLRTTDKNNSLTSKSVATPTETSWLNSVAGTSSKEDMRTSTGTISSFSEVATTEMISSPSETGNPKKSSAIDYGTNSDITTSTGRYTSLRDKTVSTLQEDAGIESTTVEGITKTVHTTVYVTTSPDNSITTETAVVVVVTNDSTATTYTEIIQTTVVEGKTLTTAIPIPQDEINKIKVIEYSTILPTTLPNGQVTSVIEKVAVAVNGQGQKVTKTAPIELGAYTTKGFEIIQDSNDIGNSVAEGYNPSAGLGGSTLVAPIAVVSNENSASLPKVNSLLVKFLLLVLLIV
ncbi:conserved hypothetical protein [Candida albicans WO-1]|uniref:Uncharacterized protein n=1 Tax=Candida albicans (strain WO-1) TaxID=294748 RepID=C4YKH8_CANAW|nr:conserved hypothetical protein [Candida albicans WO-1]